MAKHGGRSWALRALDSLACAFKGEDAIKEPLSLSTLIPGACRKVAGVTLVTVLFDIRMSVPEFAPLISLGACVNNRDTQSMPESIRPPCALPDGCRMGAVARNMEDGALQVKVLYFQGKIHPKDALQYCAGIAYCLVSRPGPWAVKKSFVSVLRQLPGFHVSWFVFGNDKDKLAGRPQSSQWAPLGQASGTPTRMPPILLGVARRQKDAGAPIPGWPYGSSDGAQ